MNTKKPTKSVNFWLFLGILFFPWFFSFALLADNYSKIARIIGFGWAVLFLFTISDISVIKQTTKQSAEKNLITPQIDKPSEQNTLLTKPPFDYEILSADIHEVKKSRYLKIRVKPNGKAPEQADLEAFTELLYKGDYKKVSLWFYFPNQGEDDAFAACLKSDTSQTLCDIVNPYNPEGGNKIIKATKKIVGKYIDWCKLKAVSTSNYRNAIHFVDNKIPFPRTSLQKVKAKQLIDQHYEHLMKQSFLEFEITSKQYDQLYDELGIDACNF